MLQANNNDAATAAAAAKTPTLNAITKNLIMFN